MAALACTLSGARLGGQVGRPRGGALSGSPLPVHVGTFPAAGCTPEADEIADPEWEAPEALLEWWRSVCAEDDAQVDDEGPPDHLASAWAMGRSADASRGGRKRRPGGASPPRVPAFSWETWVNDWLESDGGADGGWEPDGDVHWIPYEHPRSVHPGASTSVHEAGDPGPAERRSAAELDGWRAIEGHQRRNAGWVLRHGGNARMGAGLEVAGATDDERRVGYRIRHCGERLVFRAPDCECDPHARPSLVGANLCTHRMCHHCARLRSRKLAGRVRDRVGELRDGGIARYALLTLTYRDSTSLEGCIDRCWRDFRKLRERRLWEPVLGAVATIEIKRGERSGLWHPHLHVLVSRPSCGCLKGRHPYDDGPLCVHGRVWCPHALNQCCLVDAWREITGDSYVVDIRAVRADSEGDMGGAIREVVKYCTKLTEADPAEREDGLSDVLELHRAIRGRRLLVTTGAFRGLKESDSADELLEDPESRPCAFCGMPWVTVTAAWDDAMRRYVVRRSPWERNTAPPPRPPTRAAPGPLPLRVPHQPGGSGEGVTNG